MHRLKIVTAVFAVAALAGCSEPPPNPTPSPSQTLVPTELDSATHAAFGISVRPDTVTDPYGEYSPLMLRSPLRVADFDGAIVEPGLVESRGPELEMGALLAARFVVEHWIDSPLVWSEQIEDLRAFWDGSDEYWARPDVFEEHYVAADFGASFALVDDNRGSWRQAEGMEPREYVVGEPRVIVRSAELARVEDSVLDFTVAADYTFQLDYSRPVVVDGVEDQWERVTAEVTVTVGDWSGDQRIIGLAWSGARRAGIYVEGGRLGLPIYERPLTPRDGQLVQLDDISVVLPPGWETESDLATATERGLDTETHDESDLSAYYFGGPALDNGHSTYVYIGTFDRDDPLESEAERILEERGGEVPWFWASTAEGGRTTVPRARNCVILMEPMGPSDEFDRVRLTCDYGANRGLVVFAYVAPGDGAWAMPYVAATSVHAVSEHAQGD